MSSPESDADPLFRLPEGWEAMSPSEIGDWAMIEAARLGRVQRHGVKSGQGSPKGDWADYDPKPSPHAGGCPCCGASLDEASWYESEIMCDDCGYGDIDSHVYLEDAGPDRQPGDGWFGGSRPGKPGMYRNDEMAAGRIVYHEGEPVTAEQSVVAVDAYPAGWDRPLTVLDGPDGPGTPREVTQRRDKALARAKRDVRTYLAR